MQIASLSNKGIDRVRCRLETNGNQGFSDPTESSVVALKSDEPGAEARAKCDIKFRGLDNANHGKEKGGTAFVYFVLFFISLHGVLREYI
jgi:hypothetical protein